MTEGVVRTSRRLTPRSVLTVGADALGGPSSLTRPRFRANKEPQVFGLRSFVWEKREDKGVEKQQIQGSRSGSVVPDSGVRSSNTMRTLRLSPARK